jgi:alanine dehydrogenase
VIGAVLIPGAVAPRLVNEGLVRRMEPGSVIVDVAVDQGGCIETCRPTSHDDPTYQVHGVVHYCVPNMPGAVAQTSTWALTNVTLEHASGLAALGVERAAARDAALALGVNTFAGHVTCRPVAEAHGMPYTPLAELIRAD